MPMLTQSRAMSTDDGRKKKAIMVAATGQHHGKTTVTLGMVSALIKRGVKVAYQKPVGQQTVPVLCAGEELQIDRDVDIFKHVWPELIGSFRDCSPVAFPPGFTRMVLDNEVTQDELRTKCIQAFERVLPEAEYVVVEGTGHIGVGSIIDLNNAQVAKALGIDVVIVAPGGLGVSFDMLSINYAMLKEHGVKLKGVVLNKVDPDKFDMIVHYYEKALNMWGVPLLGVIPEDPALSHISMRSFAKLLKAEFVACSGEELRYFEHTRLLLSPEGQLPAEFKPQSLAIVHSSRVEVMERFVREHAEHRAQGTDMHGGLIVIGPDRPSDALIAKMEAERMPCLFHHKMNYDGTGFGMLERVLDHTHKHHKEDIGRILRTCDHVLPHINLDAVIA